MNLGQLKDAIKRWIHRDDLANDMQVFVQLAEARLSRDLRLHQHSKQVVLTAVVGETSIPLPDDYQEGRSVHGPGKWVMVTPERLGEAWAGTVGETPYSIFGGAINFPFEVVTPFDVVLTYFQRWPALVDGIDTNWLLTNYPGAYLWSSLAEAAILAEDDPTRFEAKYSQELAQLRIADVNASFFEASQGGL